MEQVNYESIANYLIDYLCELYSPKETIALLSRAGCDENQLIELRFDAADVRQVLEEEEEDES